MTVDTLIYLLPLVILALGIVVVLLALAFVRDHLVVAGLAALVLVAAFAGLFVIPGESVTVTALFLMDSYGRFFIGLMLAASLAIVVLAYGYLERRSDSPYEFYLLLLLATLGTAVLVISIHFVGFFLGLEILSVSLYALIAYLRRERRGVEAGIKYLVLAAGSAAFLLFGMALVYAATGTMQFPHITLRNVTGSTGASPVLLTGLGMMVVGFGFKLAVVPFHLWTPDVYEGAPAPVTAFVATLSKGAMLALLMRLAALIQLPQYQSVVLVFVLIALTSMIAGNLLALLQTNVKRILAYSSIAHLGYMLVAFLAAGQLGVTAVTFYLVSYFVTTLGAFGVMTVLSRAERDAEDISDYRGLFARRPWLAGIMTAMLLSLAGIPLTSGFVGKFYLVAAGVGSALWLLVLVLVLTSAIGLFYYLRIIVAMYVAEPEESARVTASRVPLAGGIALAVLTLLLVWLGVYPAPLIDLIQSAARLF